MDKKVVLSLSRLAVGQILDALRQRLETWEYTEEYLNTGYVHEPYCIEECSSPDEARRIADYYHQVIQSVETQVSSITPNFD